VRWYWVVGCDNTVADPLVVDSHDFGGIEEARLRVGTVITDWTAFAWLRATAPEDDGTPDDVLQSHLTVPVFSDRLRSALERAKIATIQFLPVRVFRPSGEEIVGFHVANVLERRAGLDTTRSDFDAFPPDYFLPERRGRVRGLRKPVLRRQALERCDVMRLEEFPVTLYASQRFKDVFEGGKFTGYSFHEVETS
jgi:hypothetical protein